jgi:signal transduction histidine kinase
VAETGSSSARLDAERLTRLIEVGRSLLSELRLEAVLDRVLETARELTGAQYAALGIMDADRRELEQFITRGVDAETHRAIGDLPRGRGILGVLIDEPRPLRLHDVTDDPRSYGFPTGHPPMHSFLGVPVVIRGRAWGNLYLTEKAGGVDFDDVDEASVVVLADWAAIAIENARLYADLESRSEELERALRGFEATSAIAQAVGAETDLARVLELVVKRGRALVRARTVLVCLVDGDDLVVAAGAGELSNATADRIKRHGSAAGTAIDRREAIRVREAGDPLFEEAARLGVQDPSAALIVPLLYRDRTLGVLAAFDSLAADPDFGPEDEQVLRAFAASAATAVATAQTVQSDRLRHSLRAAEAERRRWARELHDETLQGLGGLKVVLAGASRMDDVARIHSTLLDSVDHVTREIENLRAIITELRPAALDQLGLVPALRTLVSRVSGVQGLDIALDVKLGPEQADGRRLEPEVETTAYRVVQEALSNVVKHAEATHVDVTLSEGDGILEIAVVDDGVGFDVSSPQEGFGLVGMRERLALLGGELHMERHGNGASGTRLQAVLPLEPAG